MSTCQTVPRITRLLLLLLLLLRLLRLLLLLRLLRRLTCALDFCSRWSAAKAVSGVGGVGRCVWQSRRKSRNRRESRPTDAHPTVGPRGGAGVTAIVRTGKLRWSCAHLLAVGTGSGVRRGGVQEASSV